MYARPPGWPYGAGDFGQLIQCRCLDGMADYVPLSIVSVLHCINKRESGFPLRQVVPQMFPQAGLVGLIVQRIIHQLKRSPDVPSVTSQRLLDDRRGVA